MQIHRLGYGVKGFWITTDYAIRLNRMVTKEAQRRAKILAFWNKHGLQATLDAYEVSRRTLYNWKKQNKEGKGRLEALNPKSRTPKTRRARLWPIEVIRTIKIIRTNHPNLGKEKIYPELKEYCDKLRITCPSIATIGRLIADDPNKMRMFVRRPSCGGKRKQVKSRKNKARKPKGYIPKQPGECLALDTIEKIINGSRRYIITATDTYSRFSFAYSTNSHTSKEASFVLRAITKSFPYQIQYALTDNGSEFMKEFEHELQKQSSIHWYTYPRSPKMNAHVERFNRTIQEEFVDWHMDLLKDPYEFNKKVSDWLVWYNTKRPHKSLNLQSPIQFILNENPEECKMRWARTPTCLFT